MSPDRPARPDPFAEPLAAAAWDGSSAVEAGLAQLRQVSDPGALLAAIPQRLGPGSGLSRLVVHGIDDGQLVPLAAWSEARPPAAAALLQQLRVHALALSDEPSQAELIQRPHAVTVGDVEGDRSPLAQIMGWGGYVAAPLVVAPATPSPAILYGDRGPASVPQAGDRELIEYLAGAAGQALERAQLRRALRSERASLRATMEWLDDRSKELALAPPNLELTGTRTARAVSQLLAGPAPGSVDTLVFDGVLTPRELEVLRLVSGGASNRAIALELAISLATVKFHLNRILRKLDATNRAEAVTRYHTMMGGGEPAAQRGSRVP